MEFSSERNWNRHVFFFLEIIFLWKCEGKGGRWISERIHRRTIFNPFHKAEEIDASGSKMEFLSERFEIETTVFIFGNHFSLKILRRKSVDIRAPRARELENGNFIGEVWNAMFFLEIIFLRKRRGKRRKMYMDIRANIAVRRHRRTIFNPPRGGDWCKGSIADRKWNFYRSDLESK